MGGSDGVPSPVPNDEVVEWRPIGLDDNRTIYCNAHAHRYDLEISWWLSSSNRFSVGKLYLLKKVEAYYHPRSILL